MRVVSVMDFGFPVTIFLYVHVKKGRDLNYGDGVWAVLVPVGRQLEGGATEIDAIILGSKYGS